MDDKLKQAMLNPTSVFAHPRDVSTDSSLDKQQKLVILTNWEAEARHLQESTAEGFGGGEDDLLADIKAVKRQVAQAGSAAS